MSSSEPTDAIASSMSGEQIASLLREDGPIVSCVLLQSKTPASGAAENRPNDDEHQPNALEKTAEPTESEVEVKLEKRRVLTDLITQIPIDTTPKKCMVAQILGGPFTFLGQYEDEGVVVMVRREQDTAEERSDLVKNPHILQPPLHDSTVYGDILLMRVADNPDEDHLDSDAIDSEHDATTSKDADQANNKTASDQDDTQNKEDTSTNCGTMTSNNDFFLDYTKEEYISFASRTDILPEERDEDEDITPDEHNAQVDSDEGGEEQDGGGEDGEYTIDSDEDSESEDEDCQIGMMNLILGQILKRFQEENGRGPTTHELLTMRAALAEKLGIDCIPPIDDENDLQNESNDGKTKLETSSQESKNNDSNEDRTCPTGEKRKCPQESREDEEVKRVKFSDKDQIKIIDGYVSNSESKDDNETDIST